MWQNYFKIFQKEQIRLLSTFLLIDLQRAVECHWKLPIGTCSQHLNCTAPLWVLFFKRRAAARLTESVKRSLCSLTIPGFRSEKFPSSNTSGFCMAQRFHLDLLPLVHKLDVSVSDQQEVLLRYSCRFLCGDFNKDAFNMNFQLEKERWADQAITDCLILANRVAFRLDIIQKKHIWCDCKVTHQQQFCHLDAKCR